MRTDHTFAICAYKESEYLEECIKSIKKQSLKSNIIMVTSTPNDFIKNMAKKMISFYTLMKVKAGLHKIGILLIERLILGILLLRIKMIYI